MTASYKLSENHGTAEVGKDLWSSSGPTPCSGRVKAFRRQLRPHGIKPT